MNLPTPELRDEILAVTFDAANVTFAGDEQANNKIDMELVAHHPSLREKVVGYLGERVVGRNPDCIIAVPNGANWLAEAIKQKFPGLTLIQLKKIGEEIIFCSEQDRARAEASRRAVLVEDVVTKFTSVKRVLAVPTIGQIVMAIEAVFDRGDPTSRQAPPQPFHALVSEYIPAQLAPSSPLWAYRKTTT